MLSLIIIFFLVVLTCEIQPPPMKDFLGQLGDQNLIGNPGVDELTLFNPKFKNSLMGLSNVLGDIIAESKSFSHQIGLAIISNMENLQTIIKTRIGPWGGAYLARWGFFTYVSYRTTRIMYDLYLYESIFRYSGEKSDEFEKEMERINNLLEENIGMIDQITTGIRRINLEDFYEIERKFLDNYNQLKKSLIKMEKEVNNIIQRLEKDAEFYQKKKSGAMLNTIGSTVWTAGSFAIGITFPPSLPYLMSTKASAIVGLSLSSYNFMLSYVSGKNLDKMKYRIQKYDQLKESIYSRLNETEILLETFIEKKSEVLETLQKRSFLGKSLVFVQKFKIKFIEDNHDSISKALKYFIDSLGVISVCYFGYLIYKMVIDKKTCPSGKIRSISSTILICFLIYFAINIFISFQKDQNQQIEKQVLEFEQKQRLIREKFKQECIWYEIPIYRQLELEIKSYLLMLFSKNGLRQISMNNKGEMINDKTCKNYQISLESEQAHRYIKANVNTYFDLLIQVSKSFSKIFAKSTKILFEKTSWLTRFWITGTFTLWFYLYLRRKIK